MLSLRPDLVPKEISKEFEKLLDDCPEMSIREVKEIISAEFGKPVNFLFSNFDPRPLGSASVAQVHKARTHDGKSVAVKVQRSNINSQFSDDIALMGFIAHKLKNRLEGVDPVMIV